MANNFDYIVSLGSNFIPEKSGVSNVGSTTSYFATGFFNNLFGSFSGNFNLLAVSPLFYNNTTNTFTIRSGGKNTDGFISSGDWNNFNNLSSGNYLSINGGTLSGNLNLVSNVNILPVSSGKSNIGSSSVPFGSGYFNTVYISGHSIGQSLIGSLNIVNGLSGVFLGLNPSSRYKISWNFIWNTTQGYPLIRFNNDFGNNYSIIGLATNGGGAAARNQGNISNVYITDSINCTVGTQCNGQFEFQTKPGVPTAVMGNGQGMNITPGNGNDSFTYGFFYNGSSNITELDFFPTAGNFTGQILLYQLG